MACFAVSAALAPPTHAAFPCRLPCRSPETFPAGTQRFLGDARVMADEEPAGLRQFRAEMDERIRDFRSIQSKKDDLHSFHARIEKRIQSLQDSRLEAWGSSGVLKGERTSSPFSAATTETTASPFSEVSSGPPTPEPERHEPMWAIDDFTSMPEGLFNELLESGARARARNQHMQVRHAKGGTRRELVQFDSCVFA